MPSHESCCVYNCNNTWRNSDVKFFRFPQAKNKIDQKLKWINAVRLNNKAADTVWNPRLRDSICSAHFIGNVKSADPASLSYLPTIFPGKHKNRRINPARILNRFNKLVPESSEKNKSSVSHDIQQLKSDQNQTQKQETCNVKCENDIKDESVNDFSNLLIPVPKMSIDAECQVYVFDNRPNVWYTNTLTCNRYIYAGSSSADAEIQTEIASSKVIINHPYNVKKASKSCGTPTKYFVDTSTNTCEDDINTDWYFKGFSSIKTDKQLLDLAGVNFEDFKVLLSLLPQVNYRKINFQNRLLIFLMSIKRNLTSTAIGVLLMCHRTSITEVFKSTLQNLRCATQDFVLWPEKLAVLVNKPNSTKTNKKLIELKNASSAAGVSKESKSSDESLRPNDVCMKDSSKTEQNSEKGKVILDSNTFESIMQMIENRDDCSFIENAQSPVAQNAPVIAKKLSLNKKKIPLTSDSDDEPVVVSISLIKKLIELVKKKKEVT